MKPKLIRSDPWITQLISAIGLDGARVRRVVLDAEVGQSIKVYVECFGDERLLTIGTPPREAVQIHMTEAGARNCQDVTSPFREWLPSLRDE